MKIFAAIIFTLVATFLVFCFWPKKKPEVKEAERKTPIIIQKRDSIQEIYYPSESHRLYPKLKGGDTIRLYDCDEQPISTPIYYLDSNYNVIRRINGKDSIISANVFYTFGIK